MRRVGLPMYVVEIFLPLKRNDGSPQPRERFGEVRGQLVEKFGGLTAFTRAPAHGLWESSDGDVDRDSIVIFEVMTGDLDRDWWKDFRATLERLFEQEDIVIRASAVDRL